MKIYPWQLDLLDKMTQHKGKELKIFTAGRQTGKSLYSAQAIERLMRDLNSNPISDIQLSEGTVYGSRYYTAEPIGGNWPEMQDWCYQTFGNDSYPIWGEEKAPKPAQRWYANNRKFWFRSEADRTMFILKWR